jgi:hypothetical protein
MCWIFILDILSLSATFGSESYILLQYKNYSTLKIAAELPDPYKRNWKPEWKEYQYI